MQDVWISWEACIRVFEERTHEVVCHFELNQTVEGFFLFIKNSSTIFGKENVRWGLRWCGLVGKRKAVGNW